jgi:hypothetical protein
VIRRKERETPVELQEAYRLDDLAGGDSISQ